jgi:hypothetical protein
MRAFVPELARLPKRRVLTVTTIGDPNKGAQRHINALFGTAYATRFQVYRPRGRDMTIGRLACRWTNALTAPPARWEARWGLEVPGFVTARALQQKDPRVRVKLVTWEYGPVAQILHRGPYAGEGPSIEKLHAFLTERGYRIVGAHEEEYLTRPDVKVPRTIIRYRVKKVAARKRG